jgi:hypothetical protein
MRCIVLCREDVQYMVSSLPGYSLWQLLNWIGMKREAVKDLLQRCRNVEDTP